VVQPYFLVPPLLVLNVKVNGVTGPDLPLTVQPGAPHLLNSCDSLFGPGPYAECHPLITHADGTIVTSGNPARVGEVIALYATGLDALNASVAPTGYPVKVPVTTSTGGLILSYTYASTGPPTSPSHTIEISAKRQILFTEDWAAFVPGFIGLAQVNFTVPQIPDTLRPCSGTYNVALSLTNQAAGTINMCVQQ
jgi:uncharacterized protein (TIGR03437 family)